ncbi:pyridoxal phosphate-dependent decarboxylase family protein [Atopomonas sediminilitoris]|uniref:pyridoxal phosphate-dependent decarboxylase family protein n=1 Tax=Atopomonas sediminilitoris TaxID=2919919 RepID=UPI001F4EE531|nr:aspartate aminotransferase family protein [Atopomonas sediminilitoris]MCJ8167729.1 aspartate aminotransferase family protein [Atopomonas sediminilitoris]
MSALAPRPEWASLLLGASQASRAAYQQHMQAAVTAVDTHLLAPAAIYSGVSPQELAQRLAGLPICPEHGVGLAQASAEAAEQVLAHSVRVHQPTCVAHLHCPTLQAGQVAEVMLSAANQSLDSWDQSPAASVLEQQLCDFLVRLAGLPEQADGVFTSGGTQSNLMGLLLARDRYCAEHFACDVRVAGLPPEAHTLRVLCSEKAHFSVQQSLSLLGLGAQAAIAVAVDADQRINLQACEQALADCKARGERPFALFATAGTTDAGAIDPLPALADLACDHHLWLHVDAAWAGAALLSERLSPRLQGIARADSITLDFHKQFLQPISCGAFLLGDRQHFSLMRLHADYLNPLEDEADGVPNLVYKSLSTTRRFDALKLWLSLRAVGRADMAAMFEYGVDLAQAIAREIAQDEALELGFAPQLNAVLFRHRGQPGMTAEACDALNRRLAQQLFARGVANLSTTRLKQRQFLKMTLLNPLTTLADLRAVLEALRALASVPVSVSAQSHNEVPCV